MDDGRFVFRQKISQEIFFKKYCLHGESTAEEVFRGVADELASVEEDRELWADTFYQVMAQSLFLPAGRIFANARPDSKMKNYMNCYVIPIKDSMEDIYQALKEDALIGKMGGGVGFNVSGLRPKGTAISKGGESSGPMSFLEIFDTSAKAIHTGGQRRAAHICILNVDHPDIEEFIQYKQGDDNKRLTQFNISVGITDKFMQAVEQGADWDLVFDGRVYKTVSAKYLYDLITDNMYQHNEPGVFFLDTVNANNNGWYMYDIKSPNPCGEQPLPDYGCCCLGALKLSSFIVNPFTSDALFDEESFARTIMVAVRMLDNVLSTSEYPIPEVEKQVLSERRIGLGFTALADALAMLGIAYGSPEALAFSNSIGVLLRDTSYMASTILAEEKGVFPTYDSKMLNGGFVQTLPLHIKDHIMEHGLRNIALNTLAPVGTTSLSVGNNCSSGVEPIFSTQYTRYVTQADGSKVPSDDIYNEAWLLYKQKYPDAEVPAYFVTADKVPLEASIAMQAVFQRYIDASISKTLQLPDKFNLEDYQQLLMTAWKSGLKGITTYNPNGSLAPILSTKKEEVQNSWVAVDTLQHAKKRPTLLACDIHELTVNKQHMVVLVGMDNDDGTPYEVFLTADPDNLLGLGKAKAGELRKTRSGKYDLLVPGKKEPLVLEDIGSLFDDDYAIMCRLVSLAMRHRIPLQFIIDQLNKTKRFDTFSKTMARVLKKYIGDGEKVLAGSTVNGKCPECGENLIYVEGCKSCPSCFWSKCS